MEVKKFSSKTYEDAVTQALIYFNTTSENIKIKIIEKGSNGLFGFIGAKPWVISASLRQKEDKIIEKTDLSINSLKEEKIENKVKLEEIKEQILEAKEEKNVCSNDCELRAKEFLDKIFKIMDLNIKYEFNYNKEDRELSILLVSDSDMGILIGKRGQTLDSLQYITSLVINKNKNEYTRVKLDTENYRERRKEKLEILARNIALKAKKTKRAIALEPMNPYERRIIHSELQSDNQITTRSEGEDPYRHIVIIPKNSHRNGYRNHKNRNKNQSNNN